MLQSLAAYVLAVVTRALSASQRQAAPRSPKAFAADLVDRSPLRYPVLLLKIFGSRGSPTSRASIQSSHIYGLEAGAIILIYHLQCVSVFRLRTFGHELLHFSHVIQH